jgi:hypothetical protein
MSDIAQFSIEKGGRPREMPQRRSGQTQARLPWASDLQDAELKRTPGIRTRGTLLRGRNKGLN